MGKIKRLISLLLTLVMLLPAFALAEEEEAPVTHTAKASVALKVRRAPSDDALGGDSIPRDSLVYILEYGNVWSKVRTSRMEGWVKTQYLVDLQVVDYEAIAAQEAAREAARQEAAANPGEMEPGFTMNRRNFEEKYYAHTVRNRVAIHKEPAENASVERYLEIYSQVIVGEISGDWCFVCYKGSQYGYVRTDYLFKWDRIDPYAGQIPGLEIWNNLVFVNQRVTIYDIFTNEELGTVNPGAAFSAGDKDEFGRYPVPYDRTTGYVTEDQVAYVMPVAPWATAESGDLISVMTTFFPLGITNPQIQGRNWNIHLASNFITGTVLQPGEGFNMNQVIGPYQKATGYMSAPILSSKSTSGYGGGTCQVNTTFYICTIQVPLLVTHRKVHQNVGMDYADQGFDAAVGSGDINLTMVNTLPYAIRYQFMNSDGVLTCCIFRE
ncbi:MAG: VanW family protein [Clostridia bacterium]|nr:VanW family protein [Clostridia bacterium]